MHYFVMDAILLVVLVTRPHKNKLLYLIKLKLNLCFLPKVSDIKVVWIQ